MGLLDDAIREHLDLKRRRGADPGEIERAEREALGPVRRGPEQAESVDPEQGESLAYDHESEQHWEQPYEEAEGALPPAEEDERFDSAEPFGVEEPPVFEEPPLREAPPSPADFGHFDEPLGEDDPFAEPHDAPEPPPPHAADAPPPPAPARPPADHLPEETAEYDVEAKLDEEDRDQHADDVLEETPDFLQDTPDHDRLWFEQKPPRDFDVDG
jgi:hypothetical protein